MKDVEQTLGSGPTTTAQSAAAAHAQAHPDNVDAWRTLARISGELGDLASVERACRQIIRLQPDATAWLNLGIACQNLGRVAEAAEAYRQALRYAPGHPVALANLCGASLAQGDVDSALGYLNQMPPNHPHHAAFLHDVGMALLRKKRTQEALHCLTQLQARVPDHPGIHISLCYAWHFAGEKEKAAQAFQRSRELYEANPKRLAELAALAAEIGEMSTAVSLYQKAIAAGDRREINLFSLGCALFYTRYYREAIPYLEQVLQTSPTNASAAFYLARCFEQLADNAAARTWYLKALEHHADKPMVCCKLGMVELHCKEHAEAMAYFERALEQDKSSIEAHAGMGMVHLELGAVNKARASLQTAHELAPDRTGITNLLSCIKQKESASADADYLDVVAKLFDSFAEHFDADLVDGLEYKAPEHIENAVKEILGPSPTGVDIIDLGCGTGLCGVKVSHMAATLVGVDISAEMIRKSRERGIYTDLVVSGLDSYLASGEQRFDLALSGDVFVYFSDLKDVFEGCRRILRPGGHFVFTIALSDSDDIYLEASGRFFHSPRYIDGLAQETGFETLFGRPTVLRKEFGEGVKGMVYALRSP